MFASNYMFRILEEKILGREEFGMRKLYEFGLM